MYLSRRRIEVGGPQRNYGGLGHVDAETDAGLGRIDDAEKLEEMEPSPPESNSNVVRIGR